MLNPSLRCWVIPSFTGSYPPLLGQTLHCWVAPSVIGSNPPSLGQTLILNLFSPPPLRLILVLCLFSPSCHSLPPCHSPLIVCCHHGIKVVSLSTSSHRRVSIGIIPPTPSCLLTHWHWVRSSHLHVFLCVGIGFNPHTFASFDTSALGSLHLHIFRHVSVGILTPLSFDTSVLDSHPFVSSLSKVGEACPHPSLGIVKGNPGVFQGDLYPYPCKPIPAPRGTGFDWLG